MSERRFDQHPKPAVVPKDSIFGRLKGAMIETPAGTLMYVDKQPGTPYVSGAALRVNCIVVDPFRHLATLFYEDVDETRHEPKFNLKESAVTLFFELNGRQRIVDLNGLFYGT